MQLKGSPFAWVSYAIIVGVMGTALISPLYPLYRDAWHLQASDISLIYVVYMGGALSGLMFFGRLPDRIGALPVMRCALVLVLLGTFISLLAWNMQSLIVGRFIVGVASSLVTTGGTAGLVSLARPGQMQRVAMMSGFLIAFGFGLGPLLGGVFGQWVAAPLITAYIPTLVLAALGLLALSLLQLPANQGPIRLPVQWRDMLPKLTLPARSASLAFMLTSSLPFLAFGVFGLYASMSPLFLDKLVPWHGPVVSGSAIATILLTSSAVQMLASRLPTHWCGSLGLMSLVLSNALLMLNLWVGSAVLFALGVAFTAIGHGLCMLAGMRMVNRIASPHNRSGLLATYLVIGYIGSMIPMMAIGWIADHWGINTAVSCFCAMVMVLGLAAAWYFHRHPQVRAATP